MLQLGGGKEPAVDTEIQTGFSHAYGEAHDECFVARPQETRLFRVSTDRLHAEAGDRQFLPSPPQPSCHR